MVTSRCLFIISPYVSGVAVLQLINYDPTSKKQFQNFHGGTITFPAVQFRSACNLMSELPGKNNDRSPNCINYICVLHMIFYNSWSERTKGVVQLSSLSPISLWRIFRYAPTVGHHCIRWMRFVYRMLLDPIPTAQNENDEKSNQDGKSALFVTRCSLLIGECLHATLCHLTVIIACFLEHYSCLFSSV